MNKKNKYKAGLSFGIAMAALSILQNLLTKDNLTTNQILISIASALISSLITGILFAWLLGIFAEFLEKTINIAIEPDETILFKTRANHFKGIEGAGGKLYLTNKRLLFKSHKLNIRTHQLSISLNEIEKIERYANLGVINNGLSVTTVQGKIEKFVVEEVENWYKYLTEKNGVS